MNAKKPASAINATPTKPAPTNTALDDGGGDGVNSEYAAVKVGYAVDGKSVSGVEDDAGQDVHVIVRVLGIAYESVVVSVVAVVNVVADVRVVVAVVVIGGAGAGRGAMFPMLISATANFRSIHTPLESSLQSE